MHVECTALQEARDGCHPSADRRHRGAPRTSTSTPPPASSPTWTGASTRRSTPARRQAVEKQHAQGKKTARERIELLLDEGSFVELDEFARHRSPHFGLDEEPPLRRRRGHRLRHHRRPPGVRVRAGLHRLRRQSLGEVFGEKIVKVMDLAMKTGCPIIGINDSGGARIQEGVVSLGLYGEIFRRNVHAVRRHPADLADHGPVRRRRGLLPRDHRLHRHGRPDLAHVHHRARRDQDRHRRGRSASRSSAAPARTTPSPASPTTWPPTRTTRSSTSRRCCPTCRRTTSTDPPIFDAEHRPRAHRRATASSTRSSRTRRTSRTTCTTVIEHVLDDGEFLEVQPLFAPNIVVGFGRVEGRSVGVVANQPMQFAGTPRHRRLREGRPVRAHLRRVQHPGADLRRRARLPARHRPGVERHHPPRREADLRLRRGHRPAGHRDHPQGLRRRLRRDGLQAPRRRHQPRLADRADRGDGRPGRGEHPLPQRAQGRRGPEATSRPSAGG